jgi:hypothetical protein
VGGGVHNSPLSSGYGLSDREKRKSQTPTSGISSVGYLDEVGMMRKIINVRFGSGLKSVCGLRSREGDERRANVLSFVLIATPGRDRRYWVLYCIPTTLRISSNEMSPRLSLSLSLPLPLPCHSDH